MMWKSAGVYAVIAVIVMSLFGVRVDAETITWTNPTTYTDLSLIPVATRAQLSTELQYRIGAGAFTPFGTATGGATTLSAPYVTGGGGTSYWRVRSISVADNNATSAWSPEYTFVRPFQVPAPGQLLLVQ
jgi:hypothetical protein